MAPSIASSLLVLVPHLLGAVAFPQYTRQTNNTGGPNPARAAAVKEAFDFAWNGYYTFAFPNDELHPVSNGYGNSRQASPPKIPGRPSSNAIAGMPGARALSTR